MVSQTHHSGARGLLVAKPYAMRVASNGVETTGILR